MIVKQGMWNLPLAIGCFLIGIFAAGPSQARADGQPCTGAPVTLTAEHFERPLCIFARSRECPQAANFNCPNCNFLYEYYGPDGRYHPVQEDAVFSMLPEDVPVVILVHGSFVELEEEPYLVETYEWLRNGARDKPLLVICYRWPSAIGWKVLLGCFGVEQLAQRAEFNGFYLAQLLNRIPRNNCVKLIGHSHGCRMISAALHLLSGGKVDGMALHPAEWTNRAFRVTFFAAAMDHDWLNPGHKYGFAIHRMCWLQNHKHCLDWALLTYPWRYPGSSRALGQSGFTRKDLRLLGDQAAKIEQLDDGRGDSRMWGHALNSYLGEITITPIILNNVFSDVPEMPLRPLEELLPMPDILLPIPDPFAN